MDTKKPESFKLINWEIDTTGRLLCDEIFRMTAICKNAKFDVFIMPHRDITFYASQRYQVCTSSSGLYRFLRKKATGKILRSKTEYFGLLDFMNWLKKHSQKPIVLMCYEPYEFSPYILIQALERYDMLDKFKEMVYGFTHVYSFVKKKCKKSMSSLAIRSLAKVLLNRCDVNCFDSFNRASLVYEILLHLCVGDSVNPAEVLANEIQQYVKSVSDIEKELMLRKKRVEIQISLKPVFAPYLKMADNRRKALMLRSHLTRYDIDYTMLKTLWSKDKESFKEEVTKLLQSVADEVKRELLALLIYHFENIELNKSNVKPESSKLKIEELIKNMSIDN